ncbi:MAG TPA: Fe-S protein assembly co-chaperone HscB [Polyangiaceae bacterium]|nr:Fe-S protein assembly co-chaperone HscB [Polyangiaceae bacterium]
MDPFELLAVEPRFDLDFGAAEARHRELSSALHPDRHVRGSSVERRRALSRAIEVNEALRILKDPVRRAEALLERYGMVASESEAVASPDFLMEVLELREELAQAQRRHDVAAIQRLVENVRGRESAVEQRLIQAFRSLSAGALEANTADGGSPPIGATRERIAKTLGELRFFRRLVGEAHAILDDLD